MKANGTQESPTISVPHFSPTSGPLEITKFFHSSSYALIVKVSGQTMPEMGLWSSIFRVDPWSVIDENKLVGRWPWESGGD